MFGRSLDVLAFSLPRRVTEVEIITRWDVFWWDPLELTPQQLPTANRTLLWTLCNRWLEGTENYGILRMGF